MRWIFNARLISDKLVSRTTYVEKLTNGAMTVYKKIK